MNKRDLYTGIGAAALCTYFCTLGYIFEAKNRNMSVRTLESEPTEVNREEIWATIRPELNLDATNIESLVKYDRNTPVLANFEGPRRDEFFLYPIGFSEPILQSRIVISSTEPYEHKNDD